MNDQAASLRRLKVVASQKPVRDVTRVISFTSGKGGVGKTHSVVNVAIGLANAGRSVLVLDADLGLANVDVMAGVHVEYTLQDLFSGYRSIDEIIVSSKEGFDLIPAASGVESICNLATEQKLLLTQEIERIAPNYDYLLIDTQAGIGPDVMYFNTASSEIVCVVTPEPTSLTDAFALIKVLSRNYSERSINILANNVSGEREALELFQRLAGAIERYLQVEVRYIGHIPSDDAVRGAIKERRAVLQLYPSCPASLALSALANKIDEEFYARRVKGGMQFFFRNLLELEARGS